jgi:thioesterase domain-containing protein
MMYRALAQTLPEQFSVFGVVPRSLPSIPMIDMSVEQMAKAYLVDVRATQPHGPYYFGGLCSGGVIAYEMAVQLEAMGQEVALVAIMDAIEPRAKLNHSLIEAVDSQWPERRVLHVRPPAQSLIRAIQRRVEHTFRRRVKILSVWLRLRLLALILKTGLPWPAMLMPLTVENIYLAAKARYFPGQLRSGRVVVMTAVDGTDADEPAIYTMNDPHLGWGRVVRCQLESRSVKGGHFTMLQVPHVASLGAQLTEILKGTGSPDGNSSFDIQH